MSAMEPLCSLIRVDSSILTTTENILLEAELFTCISEELKEIFRAQHRAYFCLMKFTIEKENFMLESKFVQFIIKDILSTGEYTLAGIARYTDTYEDVLEEIMIERNMNPSAFFFRRLIDLHKSVKPHLYEIILKKITAKYLAVPEKNI